MTLPKVEPEQTARLLCTKGLMVQKLAHASADKTPQVVPEHADLAQVAMHCPQGVSTSIPLEKGFSVLPCEADDSHITCQPSAKNCYMTQSRTMTSTCLASFTVVIASYERIQVQRNVVVLPQLL